MTMNHKEAIKAAEFVFWDMEMDGGYSDMEAAILAYLDARGLVMVPKEITEDMVDAGLVGIKNNWKPLYSSGWVIDEKKLVQIVLSRAIASAPDPFNDQTTDHEKETA